MEGAGALSPDMKDAGVGPRMVAFMTGVAAECLVPAIANPALDEFRGKNARQLLHGIIAAGEIPATAAVYMLSQRNVAFTAEAYGGMQLLNLMTRLASREKGVNKSLDAESLAVRLLVKLSAIVAEIVLPTVLTQGRNVEGKGYKKLHTASSLLEGAGIGMTTLAFMTGRAELAVSGFTAYAAGRTMMLAAEVAERRMPKVNRWMKEADNMIGQSAKVVAEYAKSRATDVWNKIKSIGHKKNGGEFDG